MLEIKDLAFSYPGHDILKGISLSAAPGTCTAILGNNGTGKSTLIRCAVRILHASAGEVLLDGKNVAQMSRLERARSIAYVAQSEGLSRMTVFDAVLMGRKPYIRWNAQEEDLKLCEDMLRRVDMESYALRYIDELSGGEAQKVLLARALVQQPKVLLLDEPTSSLDPRNQYEMLALVRELASEKQLTVLMVLHDLNLALRFCDHFFLMKDGAGYVFGDIHIMTEENIENVYGIGVKMMDLDGRKVAVVG